jgi:GNAT superfamily N-acetyltransferase
MKIDFRLAGENDFATLLPMMADFNAIDGYHFDEATTTKNLQRFIANEQLGKLWLIYADEQVIGYVVLAACFSFEFKGFTAFIDELYLVQSYRGKGVGGQVIDFIEMQARRMEIKALHLEVERHNEKGKKLYQKKGFKEHERALMTKRFI